MRCVSISVLFLLTSVLSAQVGRNEWVVSTFTDYLSSQTPGGLWHVDAARTTATLLGNQTPNMVGANCVAVDDAGLVYYGTLRSTQVTVPNPGEILRVVVAGTNVVSETVLTLGPIDTGSISGIAVVRDRIWFVTDAGNVGWLPRTGGAANVVLNLPAAGAIGLGQSIASDGRQVFVGTSYTATTPGPVVYAFDGAAAAPTLTPLASLGGSAFAMSLARDGKLVVGRIGGQLWSIDPRAGTSTQLNAGALAPQSNCNGTAINPWSEVVGNVPGFGSTTRVVGFYDVASNTWPSTLNLNLAVPSGVASAHEQPFLLFGRGCPGANGQDPRLGWSGLPLQGQSFTLDVRRADPGIAILFLGFSDQVGPLGPLPFDLGQVGAPGCTAYVSTEAALTTPVSPTGEGALTLAVPANPALAGLQLFAQWAVASTVNTLGLATSDAVHVQVR